MVAPGPTAALRAENAALVELLLKQGKLLPAEDIEIGVNIPVQMQSMGREPWYMRQARLEKKYRKPKLSEIAGIPEEAQEDAGSII